MKEAVSKLRPGLLFALVDFYLGRWDILPSFLGYLIFLECLKKMALEYPDILRLRPFCKIMTVVTLITWVISINIPLLSLFATLMEIYVIFILLSTVSDYTVSHGYRTGIRLKTYKNILAFSQVVMFAFMGYMGDYSFLAGVAYLVLFLLIEMQISYILEEMGEGYAGVV